MLRICCNQGQVKYCLLLLRICGNQGQIKYCLLLRICGNQGLYNDTFIYTWYLWNFIPNKKVGIIFIETILDHSEISTLRYDSSYRTFSTKTFLGNIHQLPLIPATLWSFCCVCVWWEEGWLKKMVASFCSQFLLQFPTEWYQFYAQ